MATTLPDDKFLGIHMGAKILAESPITGEYVPFLTCGAAWAYAKRYPETVSPWVNIIELLYKLQTDIDLQKRIKHIRFVGLGNFAQHQILSETDSGSAYYENAFYTETTREILNMWNDPRPGEILGLKLTIAGKGTKKREGLFYLSQTAYRKTKILVEFSFDKYETLSDFVQKRDNPVPGEFHIYFGRCQYEPRTRTKTNISSDPAYGDDKTTVDLKSCDYRGTVFITIGQIGEEFMPTN